MKRTKGIFLIAVLLLTITMLISCKTETTTKTEFNVHFELGDTYETNNIFDQSIKLGKKAKKPNVVVLSENPENYQVSGWYLEPTYETEWNFKKDTIDSDITLYARWLRLFTVDLYDGVFGTLLESNDVFDGLTIKENLDYAYGYEYQGTFKNEEMTIPFDYASPVDSNLSLYIKHSDTFKLYESNKTGSLSDMIEMYEDTASSLYPEMHAEAGYAEPIELDGETYTYVNFGYSPIIGDGFMELNDKFNIENADILRITCKILGDPVAFTIYYTTYVNDDDYSVTGSQYSQTFSSQHNLLKSEKKMSIDDDWLTLDFNLSNESIIDGYSVWGNSKYIGKVRLQASYKATDPEDLSNEIIFKSIEGIKDPEKDYSAADTERIKDISVDSSKTEIEEAKNNQTKVNGLVFPLDNAALSSGDTVSANVYNRADGILFTTENYFDYVKTGSTKSFIAFDIDKDTIISLDENPTFNLELQNLGYQGNLGIYIYNDEGDCLATTVQIKTNRGNSEVYTFNFAKDSSMYGNVTRIAFDYVPYGIDNAILFKSIFFSKFKPFDVVGINMSDPEFYGFESNANVDLSFNKINETTLFNVKKTGAIVSVNKPYEFTNDTYTKMTLEYFLPITSQVEKVIATFTVNGENVRNEFNLSLDDRGKKKLYSVVDLDLEKRGSISALSLEFVGTGTVEISRIQFNLPVESFDLAKNWKGAYLADWNTFSYSYDNINDCADLLNESGKELHWTFYIGYGHKNLQYKTLYPMTNVDIRNKKYIKIVYQNRSNLSILPVALGFDRTPDGHSDNYLDGQILRNTPIASDMGEYEWKVAVVEIPEEFINENVYYYLAKISIRFTDSIKLRSVVIE